MQSRPGEYEFLPHTADAKFVAQGTTMEELFTNCARAMFAVLTDVELVKPRLRFPIKFKAKSKEAALFDFLDKLIFLLDTEGFVLNTCEEMHVSANCDGTFSIDAIAVGDFHKGYDVAGQVKAVTYNDMKIESTKKGFMAQVVVDI